jgi:hypothetical protein
MFGAGDDPLPRQFRALTIVTMTLAILCIDVWMCALLPAGGGLQRDSLHHCG